MISFSSCSGMDNGFIIEKLTYSLVTGPWKWYWLMMDSFTDTSYSTNGYLLTTPIYSNVSSILDKYKSTSILVSNVFSINSNCPVNDSGWNSADIVWTDTLGWLCGNSFCINTSTWISCVRSKKGTTSTEYSSSTSFRFRFFCSIWLYVNVCDTFCSTRSVRPSNW